MDEEYYKLFFNNDGVVDISNKGEILKVQTLTDSNFKKIILIKKVK
ncbi:MAG: hypothetical protein RR561_05205 [Peptostreptococcus sp.]